MQQVLRLLPIANNRWQSRGLHPIGALCVPQQDRHPQWVHRKSTERNSYGRKMNPRPIYDGTYSNIFLQSCTLIIRHLVGIAHLLQVLGHQLCLDHRLFAGSSLVLWHSMQIEYVDKRSRCWGWSSQRSHNRVNTGSGRTLPPRKFMFTSSACTPFFVSSAWNTSCSSGVNTSSESELGVSL